MPVFNEAPTDNRLFLSPTVYSKLSAAMLQQESCSVFEDLKIIEAEYLYLAKWTCLQS